MMDFLFLRYCRCSGDYYVGDDSKSANDTIINDVSCYVGDESQSDNTIEVHRAQCIYSCMIIEHIIE